MEDDISKARPAPPRPTGPAGMGPPRFPPQNAAPIGNDPMLRMMLPVGRSGYAIAAGYLGLISVLFLPAPFALLCGILAVRDIKRHPDTHGMGRAIFGIVMGALGTLGLVAAVIGVIASAVKN